MKQIVREDHKTRQTAWKDASVKRSSKVLRNLGICENKISIQLRSCRRVILHKVRVSRILVRTILIASFDLMHNGESSCQVVPVGSSPWWIMTPLVGNIHPPRHVPTSASVASHLWSFSPFQTPHFISFIIPIVTSHQEAIQGSFRCKLNWH